MIINKRSEERDMKANYVNLQKSIIATLLAVIMVLISALTMPASLVQASAKAAPPPVFTKLSYYVLLKDTSKLGIKNKVKGSVYEWTTSNKKIASVAKDGTVKGISKGTVTITCKIKTPKKSYSLKSKVTVIKPAVVFEIYNKIKVMNVGQEYDLNRMITPASSNDKTIWSSSNKKIAVPDQNGKFKVLKEGTVTIKGTTLSGKSDSVTIKVIDADGKVSTQEELIALLGTGVSRITLKTEEAVTVTIPQGVYQDTKLIVDAPKADIYNNATFSSVDIKNIAANTWYENAVGNLLNILAENSRVVVGKDAVVSIEVSASGAKLIIVNNGTIQEIVVDKESTLDISGKSTQKVPVVVNVPKITITTSIPLALECKEKITLVLGKGAEGTTVAVTDKNFIPEVKGEISVAVTIGTGDHATKTVVEGTPTGGTSSGGGGGSTGGNGETPSQTYTITSLSTLKSIDVTYGGATYNVSADMLNLLRFFLTFDGAIASWQNTADETHQYTSSTGTVTVRVEATALGASTKKVTLSGGSFGAGRSYIATVNGSAKSVGITSKQSNLSFTVTMNGSNSINISPIPASLIFKEH